MGVADNKRTMNKPKRRSTKRSSKRTLAGFTKVKGKYALVFRSNNKLSIGKSRFKSKKTLMTKAKKFAR